MKNNYNFGVVKLHLKFNQRTKSTPHKFQTRLPSQNLILFQPDLCLEKGMWLNMKKKLLKIASIIILILIILATQTITFADEYRPEDLNGEISGDDYIIKNVGNQIIGVLQAIGIVVSVVVLIILGIKYMMGSIDQRAEYKKSMLTYVIRASGLLSASVIANIIMNAVT